MPLNLHDIVHSANPRSRAVENGLFVSYRGIFLLAQSVSKSSIGFDLFYFHFQHLLYLFFEIV